VSKNKPVRLLKDLAPMKTLRWFSAVLFLSNVILFAQENRGLSEADIVRLHSAGFSDDTIVHQIQYEGVSFHLDASTTIRLKAAGISETVINALLTRGTGQDSGPHDSALIAKQLYAEQKYDQLRQYLQQQLTEHLERTDASKLRSLLILVSLRQDDLGAAKSQLSILDQDQSTAGQTYAKKVRATVTGYETAQADKQKLVVALNSFDAKKAKQIISDLSVSDAQKAILRAQIALYEGQYDDARKLALGAENIGSISLKMRDKIDETEASYTRLSAEIDSQLYSPLVPSDCLNYPGWFQKHESEFSSLSLTGFLNKTQELFVVAPLNERSLDLQFFSAILSSPAESVIRIGDQILGSKGSITLPFYASDRFFSVVIDFDRHRVYTKDDPHQFSVNYVIHLPGPHTRKQSTNPNVHNLEAFDLAFNDIPAIEQHVGRTGWSTVTWMSKESYALKLGPHSVAPNYAFMQYMDCVAGQPAGKRATRNIGAYLAHVIGRPDVKVALDEEKDRGGTSTFEAVMLGAVAGSLGATGNVAGQQMVLQAADSEIAANVKMAEQQSKQWASVLSLQMQALDVGIFKDLEQMLNL
jgi:hypothetical protein